MRCYNAAMKVPPILMVLSGIVALLLGAYSLIGAEFGRNAWPEQYEFERLLGWSIVGAGATLIVAGAVSAKRR
jgi:hypothetical protein